MCLIMDIPFNIVIATGAFKDVFSPLEASEMIADAVRATADDAERVRINVIPMADGGEFSDEVLASQCACRRIRVDDSVDPRGEIAGGEYLSLEGGAAFIASVQALGLPPIHYRHKNPMNLTSYGLGQLIQHAARAGFKELIIGMGGTSTVDAGIGMAQALGVQFLDDAGAVVRPQFGPYLAGGDLVRVRSIVWDSVPTDLEDLDITVLCDTRISVSEMQLPTEMKIGKVFESQKESILSSLQSGLHAYSEVMGRALSSRGRLPDEAGTDLFRQDSLGVAGGVLLSLLAIARPRLVPGGEFFIKRLGLEDAVLEADLVITGEGKFDISLKGKTPAGVSALAQRHDKPVLLVCGSIAPEYKKYFSEGLATHLPDELTASGITAMISCHERFDSLDLPESYEEEMSLYRRETPIFLAEPLRAYLSERTKAVT